MQHQRRHAFYVIFSFYNQKQPAQLGGYNPMNGGLVPCIKFLTGNRYSYCYASREPMCAAQLASYKLCKSRSVIVAKVSLAEFDKLTRTNKKSTNWPLNRFAIDLQSALQPALHRCGKKGKHATIAPLVWLLFGSGAWLFY